MKRFLLLLSLVLFSLLAANVNADQDAKLDAPEIAKGIELYEEHCSRCHGAFDSTTKPQRSIRRLKSSIEHFPAMRSLDFLDDEQLAVLASALATVSL